NTVKNLALSSAIMGQISPKKNSPGLDMEGFWRHSLCVGVSAKILAKRRGIDAKQTEEYFTAGLLHDIGKIPLNAVLAKNYMLTVSSADRERKSLYQMEQSALGLNHCTAGAMISAAWKLEGAVGDTIVYHHDCAGYSGSNQDILYSVIAANRFASLSGIGFSGDRYPEKVDPVVWETLNATWEDFDEIEKMVNGEIEKAEIFLKIGHLAV
ncbi:MAG: HDOD domain-containing protein, partial [Treponema sp.]|nr:HDOD domain-containing protein [Treponema sp.]